MEAVWMHCFFFFFFFFDKLWLFIYFIYFLFLFIYLFIFFLFVCLLNLFLYRPRIPDWIVLVASSGPELLCRRGRWRKRKRRKKRRKRRKRRKKRKRRKRSRGRGSRTFQHGPKGGGAVDTPDGVSSIFLLQESVSVHHPLPFASPTRCY